MTIGRHREMSSSVVATFVLSTGDSNSGLKMIDYVTKLPNKSLQLNNRESQTPYTMTALSRRQYTMGLPCHVMTLDPPHNSEITFACFGHVLPQTSCFKSSELLPCQRFVRQTVHHSTIRDRSQGVTQTRFLQVILKRHIVPLSIGSRVRVCTATSTVHLVLCWEQACILE